MARQISMYYHRYLLAQLMQWIKVGKPNKLSPTKAY